jgi:hypothetical protein
MAQMMIKAHFRTATILEGDISEEGRPTDRQILTARNGDTFGPSGERGYRRSGSPDVHFLHTLPLAVALGHRPRTARDTFESE